MRALKLDDIFDMIQAVEVAGRLLLTPAAAIAVGVHGPHHTGDTGLGSPAARLSGQADGPGGRAVIGTITNQNFLPPGGQARNPHGMFIRLRPAQRQKRPFERTGADLGQELMQPGPRLGHEMRHHIGQLLGLLPNGGQHTRIPVADIDAHQLRVEVKKAFAVGRPEVHALSVVNAERLHRLLRRPFVQAVLPSQAYNLVRREIAHMRLLFLVFPLVVLHSSSSRCQ